MEQLNSYSYLILPLCIFIAKILDVSMGTIRIVLISKNKRVAASFLSFFEMFIWLMAISNIMRNLDNLMCCLAYACGYSAGVYLGMVIEEKITNGNYLHGFQKKFQLSRILPMSILFRK